MFFCRFINFYVSFYILQFNASITIDAITLAIQELMHFMTELSKAMPIQRFERIFKIALTTIRILYKFMVRGTYRIIYIYIYIYIYEFSNNCSCIVQYAFKSMAQKEVKISQKCSYISNELGIIPI